MNNLEYIGNGMYVEIFFNSKQVKGRKIKDMDYSIASGSVDDILYLSSMWGDEEKRILLLEYLDELDVLDDDDDDDSVIVYVYRV